MEYTYATLLLTETGAKIDERNVERVLAAAGADPETSRVKALVAALEGVDVEDIAAGDRDDSADPGTDGAASPRPDGGI